ncbi:ATP-dependent Clp protease proteolytic subunit [Aldersonia sp. NBC_00410]|uniref:ClpP family protease n=1 Tax=Aldersonia sp. NBC_00410 TaxID=2975954 RepID=UPI00225712E9|nr:ATP-dependent Clp protease proteolytic subunit [Aldersonia sp. NBC_00410]MCX5045082.1 ATP-dependent Clp protease proteolytic subunit [Aldersonia sp. NBC_00410]
MRIRAQLEAILSKHTGRTVEELRHDTDRDRVFDAAAAVGYGLADHVLDERV